MRMEITFFSPSWLNALRWKSLSCIQKMHYILREYIALNSLQTIPCILTATMSYNYQTVRHTNPETHGVAVN